MTKRGLGLALLAVALVVLVNARPTPPSPGRWKVDPHRAVTADVDWVTAYLEPTPQVGDRIPARLWVAWAEGETGWARAYLARQAAALDRLAGRIENQADRQHIAQARKRIDAARHEVALWPSANQGAAREPSGKGDAR